MSEGQVMDSAKRIQTLVDEVAALTKTKNEAYTERNLCVAALARMAQANDLKVGVGLHDAADKLWDHAWRFIIFIELPTGQVSWHFHQDELPLFKDFATYEAPYDGHSTPEKYNRLMAYKPERAIKAKVQQITEELRDELVQVVEAARTELIEHSKLFNVFTQVIETKREKLLATIETRLRGVS